MHFKSSVLSAIALASCSLAGRAHAQEEGEKAPPPAASGTATQGNAPAVPSSTPLEVKVIALPATPAPATAVSLDNLKGGKLIANGFSVGGAYSVHIPAGGTAFQAQDVNTSFMPYAVFYPFMFWPGSGEETRAYCSAAWTFSPPESAQKIADSHARERARKKLGLESGENLTSEQIKQETGWKPGAPPYCQYRLVGLYLGKPLGISPSVKSPPERELKDATPSATSVVSFGLAWSPNIAFSLLAGATHWRFPTDATPSVNEGFWTYSISLGGNLDILGALAK